MALIISEISTKPSYVNICNGVISLTEDISLASKFRYNNSEVKNLVKIISSKYKSKNFTIRQVSHP